MSPEKQVKQELTELKIDFEVQDENSTVKEVVTSVESMESSQVTEDSSGTKTGTITQKNNELVMEPVRGFASHSKCKTEAGKDTSMSDTEVYLEQEAAPDISYKTETDHTGPPGVSEMSIHCTTKKSYNCLNCKKEFSNQSELLVHQQTHSECHKNVYVRYKLIGNNYYECSICAKVVTKVNLTEHAHMHINQSKLSTTLGSTTSGYATKKRHKLPEFANEKPYSCDICSRVFSLKRYLTVHRRYHTDTKPFTCVICKKSFSKRSNLNTHLQNKHEGIKPFQCDICQESFDEKRNLFIHNRIVHLVTRPYTCDVCQSSFINTGYLARHKRTVHKDTPLFTCDICNKIYNSKRYFMEHRNGHFGEKPFECDQYRCHKRYNAKRSLDKHKQTHVQKEQPTDTETAESELNQDAQQLYLLTVGTQSEVA